MSAHAADRDPCPPVLFAELDVDQAARAQRAQVPGRPVGTPRSGAVEEPSTSVTVKLLAGGLS